MGEGGHAVPPSDGCVEMEIVSVLWYGACVERAELVHVNTQFCGDGGGAGEEPPHLLLLGQGRRRRFCA